MRESYNFTIKKEDHPVEMLYAMEDLREKLNIVGIRVDDNTLYTCVVFALPAAEYALEIRDLNLKQAHDRKDIINLVRSKYETLAKSTGSSDSLARVGKRGSNYGRKDRKAHGGSGKVWKRKGRQRHRQFKRRSRESEGFDGEVVPCRVAGHYSEGCTATLCTRCGGRGYVRFAGGHGRITGGTVLAMVQDLEDDAVEATAF